MANPGPRLKNRLKVGYRTCEELQSFGSLFARHYGNFFIFSGSQDTEIFISRILNLK